MKQLSNCGDTSQLTADAMDGDREKCLEKGMSEYLSKPVRQKHLHGLLSAWVVSPAMMAESQGAETDNMETRKQGEAVKEAHNQAAESGVNVSGETVPEESVADQSGQSSNTDVQSVSGEQLASNDTGEAEGSDSVINMKAIDTIRSLQRPGKPDLLGKVAHLFLDKTPGAIVEMQAALEQGDTAAIKAHVHALKSSSAYLGADNLSEICREIEAKAAAEDIEAVGSLLENFVAEYDLVAQELVNILDAAA